jgi:hypothetical protein
VSDLKQIQEKFKLQKKFKLHAPEHSRPSKEYKLFASFFFCIQTSAMIRTWKIREQINQRELDSY